ncbi:hypothetical protein GCM10027020_15920 [Nocardioides salsibiostraticola]
MPGDWHTDEVNRPPSKRLNAVVDRAQSRSIWWFVALAVLVAFIPVSTPVTIGLYVFLIVICWVPMGAAIRDGFRRGRTGR